MSDNVNNNDECDRNINDILRDDGLWHVFSHSTLTELEAARKVCRFWHYWASSRYRHHRSVHIEEYKVGDRFADMQKGIHDLAHFERVLPAYLTELQAEKLVSGQG